MEGPAAPTPDSSNPPLGPAPPEAAVPPALQETGDAAGGFVLPEWASFLRNRIILGGLSGIVVLLLVAIVLVALGGGDGDAEPSQAAVVNTPKPLPTSSEGLSGKIIVTITLRNGPGFNYAVLGIIPKGATVAVVGRDEDETWLQVLPPSGVQGWVPAGAVQVGGDISALAIGSIGEGPSVPAPTEPEPVFIPEEEPTLPPPTQVRPTATRPPPPTATAPPRVPPTPRPPTPAPTPPRGPQHRSVERLLD